MSFWPFGQNTNSASSLNGLLDAYYLKRTMSSAQQQPLADVPEDDSQSDLDTLEDLVIDKDFVAGILDDASVLNELNRQNNKLIDFVCFGYIDDKEDQPSEGEGPDEQGAPESGTSVLDILVSLVVDSAQWFEDNEKYFQPCAGSDDELEENELLSTMANRIHVASEILSCKIWLISETLVEETSLVSKLWSFLDVPHKPSSPTIQFFVKINEQLLESRPDQMLNFIRSQETVVDSFVRHIDITTIMDFLLRIITTDKPNDPTGIIEILSEQQLINKLLALLREDSDTSTQSSCGDFLKALISISANTSIDENTIGPNLLTKELVGHRCIAEIIEIILQRGSGLSTVVGVVIEIIRKNNSDYDPFNILYSSVESHPPSSRDPVYLGPMLKNFSNKLPEFNQILLDPKLSSKRVKTQINKDIEPLGFERFKICELVAELLHCSNIQLLNNNLTPKVVAERERFVVEQESNLASALNEDIAPAQSTLNNKANASLNISNLNIGTSEPVVAVNEKNITISPHSSPVVITDVEQGELPFTDLPDSHVISRRDEIKANPTEGDFFKIKLADSGILATIIKMFNKYPWNNFWHNVVFDVVQQIFNGRLDSGYNQFLILELFDTCEITKLIIDSYELCHETESTTNVRLGYMGHLVLIAEEVVKFSSVFQDSKFNDGNIDELIYSKLVDPKWVAYVTNVLSETREQYNCVLGGIKTDDFQQTEYLNENAIILGNSEEEILGQEPDSAPPLDEAFVSDSEPDHLPADVDGDQRMTNV